jgi:hypothetical protein
MGKELLNYLSTVLSVVGKFKWESRKVHILNELKAVLRA